jgi:hypothetical protein
MSRIEAQVNKLFRDIPDSSRKAEIMQEISQNLGEKVSDLVAQGISEEDAMRRALEDIGDIGEIRKELVGNAQLLRNRNLGLSLAFSVWGSIIIAALVIFVNFYYSPNHIWFVYPVFAVIWWPMSIFFHWYHVKSGNNMAFPYSIAGAGLFILLMLFINFYYVPHTIWFVYPTFAVIWWPIALCFHWLRQKNREDDDLE